MTGFDLTDPTTVVTPTAKTVIPEPEKHFSFTTILMEMTIELYQEESERKFCHNVTYAHQKLVNFVESRKQMTTESYKFSLKMPAISLSRTQHSTLLQEPRRRPRTSQVMVLHMSAPNFLVMCGLVQKQSLFTFPEDQAG